MAQPGPWRRALDYLLRGDPVIALGIVWLPMLLVQFGSDNILGIDGYYHIKMAWIMRQEGIALSFPWLPLTILNPERFTNHHLLFHILLIPFSGFTDLRLAGKAAGLLYGVLALFTVYLVSTRLRVRVPLFWLFVLLASAEWFLVRNSMTRRQSVALALVVLAVYLLASGRFRLLAPLAFAYTWLFDGFVLLLGVSGAGFLARLIAQRQCCWPLLGWTVTGMALGVLAHPYFPNNIAFTILHVAPKLFMDGEVRVGGEWYPYSQEALLKTSWLAVLMVPAGLLLGLFSVRRALRDHRALLLGGVAVLFLLLYLRSRRFVESEPAFALLFFAYMWSFHPPRFRGRRIWSYLPRAGQVVLAAALVVSVGGLAVRTVQTARGLARDNHPFTTFQASSVWLARNTEPLERVFQTDWDDFPELFFFNSHNTYIVGLDPTYMYLQNAELYRLWRDIGRGLVERPSVPIRERFQARYVISDRQHGAFIGKAQADPDLEVAYESGGSVVYRVRAAGSR